MTVRVGVIGLGVGEAHAGAWAAQPGFELATICDIDADVLATVAEDHPDAHATTDADELLANPDIGCVSVASYDDAHFEQVKAALSAGKHVFSEKPVCMRAEEARELRALLAERPELRLSSNLPLRASPRFRRVGALVREGAFGRIYHAETAYDYGRLEKITEGWRGELPHYSVTLGGGVHVVDLILWLTGEKPVEAVAYGNRLATEGTRFRFDDMVAALVRFESGMVARITSNFASVHPHFHELVLWGTDASFRNGLETGVLRRAGGEEELLDEPYPGVGKGDLIPAFARWVLGEGAPVVTPDEVFASLAVCLAIDVAAAEGRAAPVPNL